MDGFGRRAKLLGGRAVRQGERHRGAISPSGHVHERRAYASHRLSSVMERPPREVVAESRFPMFARGGDVPVLSLREGLHAASCVITPAGGRSRREPDVAANIITKAPL